MEMAKIKALLLEAVGNPESGAIAENAEVMAKAIADEFNGKDEVKEFNPVKETRIIKPTEAR
jgi:hypothetical protein